MTPSEDWAADLAHLALVDETLTRLRAAEASALATEAAVYHARAEREETADA